MRYRPALPLIIAGSLTLVTACGGSDDSSNTPPEPSQPDTSQPETSQPDTTPPSSNTDTDITGALLSSRNVDCSNYEGSYVATATDINRGQEFDASLTVSVDANSCNFVSNEIPNHDFNDGSTSFVTPVSEQDADFRVNKMPAQVGTTTALSLSTTNAVFLNGVTLDLLAAACYDVGNEPLGREKIGCGENEINNPWRYDPMSPLNDFGTDSHNAHSQPDGSYHYHGNPVAMFEQECDLSGIASPVIGYAADGFPVFGSCYQDPQTGNIVKASSSYRLKANGGMRQAVQGYTTPSGGTGVVASNNYDGQFIGDWEYVAGTGVLDECNGMTVNGEYGYYVTDTYPWVLACFKGEVNTSFIKSVQDMTNTLHIHGSAM